MQHIDFIGVEHKISCIFGQINSTRHAKRSMDHKVEPIFPTPTISNIMAKIRG